MLELIAASALLCLYMLIRYPEPGFIAAIQGITIWWDILFPALFPFLVISEMLLGFGIVHFLGTLLDPLMRPLFRIPGIGGFVVAMGFASGYPVGARLTSQLSEQGLLNRDEGERLVAFTTSSDPIFLIGAVSIGFFHDVRLAVIIAIAHYGAALALGFLMRFHGTKKLTPATNDLPAKKGSLLVRSFNAMHIARLKDARPIGLLLQQAIRSSIELVFVIGGLVVFFSVIIAYLSLGPVMELLTTCLRFLLQVIQIPPALSTSLINGFFEVTLGAKSAGQASEAVPLVYKVAAATFILSWGGLSVHAQVVSILHRTNIRYITFAIARLIHGVLAACLVFLIWKPLKPIEGAAAPAFSNYNYQPWRMLVNYESILPLAILGGLIVLLIIIDYDKRITASRELK
ncbi:sporulation integral membrane protein YlbJ [Paenibacillus psychroresistens]|uniref:Sporulation integral membrane protein YlbJ n=2 Tax=Paenibacillus psychroresistens TaxID=1778678 RepID=A0A6B8RVQ2_9BACL|nr:sporulation integral membrane protein YlbJ [Paenibacillus psychroresistens]